MILTVDIYSRNTWWKIAFLVFCAMVGAASLYITDKLVTKLEEREKQQIEIYAESFKYMMTSEPNKDVNFFFEKIKKSNENNTIPIISKDGSGYLDSKNIQVPEGITSAEKQAFLKDKLSEAIDSLQVLFESDCTAEKAAKAWDEVFNTTYFTDKNNQRKNEEKATKIRAVANTYPTSAKPWGN